MQLGAIEAGGTKFVCGIGDETGQIIEQIRIPTTTPTETLAGVTAFFKQHPVAAIGIGSFGPIGVNAKHRDFGYITNTPKAGWENFNFLGYIRTHLNIPVYWTTDVNVAAYGEYQLGAGKDIDNLVYFTVGTGIGAGVIYQGKFLRGFNHLEAGHILIKHLPTDHFAGVCPYHADCLEGLASGPALEQRFNASAAELANRPEVWQLEATYIAQACVNYTLSYSPDRIVIGGGVMHQEQLFPLIREAFTNLLGHYTETPDVMNYIQRIKLNDDAGLTGCLLLANELIATGQTVGS